MKIYTSYFGNIVMLKDNNILPVGICCYPPKDFEGINISYVAPTPEILSNYKGNHPEYIKHYNNILNDLDIHNFIDELIDISNENNGKSIALCCYERPSEFCHRHLLAEYLNNKKPELDIHEFSAKDVMLSNELF